MADYPKIIVLFILNKIKDESSIMVFEEKDAPHCNYSDKKLKENYENIDESVLKVDTEEKSHLSNTVIGEPLYVTF
jgi:hypothetical protein